MHEVQMIATTGWGTRLRDFVRLGRPLFLVGGFSMYALGAAAALYAGATLDLPALLWGQLAVSATQLMVHYANDYFDLPADALNRTPTQWSGGSRILPAGRLPPRVALVAALACMASGIAAAAVLAFVQRTGPYTLPLIALALFLAWSYSAPPFRWHWRGLGELTTALVVPGLTPVLGCYLQAGGFSPVLLLAQVPLVLLQIAMQLSVNFPDARGDHAAGKHTLVTRLGPASARLYAGLLAFAFGSLPLLTLAGLPLLAAGAVGLLAPLAAWQARRVVRGGWADPRRWNSIAFFSVALLIAAAWLEVAAFLWLRFG